MSIKVHAGDWGSGQARIGFKGINLPKGFWGEDVPLNQLETVEIATEESVKKLGGTLGWGAAGAVLLGPVGLLAGLLAGGRGKNVTFVARFKDGRKFMGTTDAKTYTKLSALAF